MNPDEIYTATREQLADISHEIWSSWTRWQFSVCTPNADGSLTIPASLVERWTRQMNTPYAELSEREKDSDREQADKIMSPFMTTEADVVQALFGAD
jgi:hypothetical protein